MDVIEATIPIASNPKWRRFPKETGELTNFNKAEKTLKLKFISQVLL